tara:strand:- start:131 stop:439 length:309 start_codon:yes stop_codon:yes gene_type:complete
MKKLNYLFVPFAFIALSTMTSCSKDECHECHIAYMPAGGGAEIVVEFGEFCGDALEEVEADGYTVTIEETIIGSDTVPAGTYGNGNMEIHCEEHGDHDDHDH